MALQDIGPRIYRDTGEGGGGSGEGEGEGETVILKPGQKVISERDYNKDIAKLTALKADLRKIVGDNGSVDDAAAKLARLAELETKQAESQGQYKELLATEREKRKVAEDAAAKIRGDWEAEKLGNAVRDAAVKAGALSPAQVLAIYGGRAKVAEGKLIHAETGADFVEFLAEEAKGDNANLFKPPGKPGSGASPGNRTSGANGTHTTTPAHIQATIEAGKAAGLY